LPSLPCCTCGHPHCTYPLCRCARRLPRSLFDHFMPAFVCCATHWFTFTLHRVKKKKKGFPVLPPHLRFVHHHLTPGRYAGSASPCCTHARVRITRFVAPTHSVLLTPGALLVTFALPRHSIRCRVMPIWLLERSHIPCKLAFCYPPRRYGYYTVLRILIQLQFCPSVSAPCYTHTSGCSHPIHTDSHTVYLSYTTVCLTRFT